MDLQKNIAIAGKLKDLNREVRIYIVDKLYPESAALSELELDAIAEIIQDLEKLLTNITSDYLQWGVDSFSVVSFAVISKCRNDMEDTDLPEVSTASLLHMMQEIKSTKEKFSDPDMLSSLAGRAFDFIKTDPAGFKKWEKATYYEIVVDNVLISLSLSAEDLTLSAADYLKQLDKIY